MLRYEILILTVPEITVDESKNIESNIESIVEASKGSIISYERWGKYKLAYPVKHHEYGIYFLVRFQIHQENTKNLLNELHEYFAVKQTEIVMRHMVAKLAKGESLEYKKPESLEDIPSGDIDSFLKENKMPNILKDSGRSENSENIDNNNNTDNDINNDDLQEDVEFVEQ